MADIMFSQIINLISVSVALAAVGVAIFQMNRNQKSAARANALPVLTELFGSASRIQAEIGLRSLASAGRDRVDQRSDG
jgi:hypothetical protein